MRKRRGESKAVGSEAHGGALADDPQPELSLNALSEAFAEALGRGGEATKPTQQTAGDEANPSAAGAMDPIPPDDDSADAGGDLAAAPGDEQCEISPLSILEALLFVGDPAGGALPAARLAGVMRGVEPGEIHGLVRELNRRYSAAGTAFLVVGEGDGYRLALRDQHRGVRRKFFGRVRQARLSQAAIDVLALVAYRQPVTGDQISQLRGKPSGPVLTQLVRRQLLRIERPVGKPKPVHYRTTRRFLELFHLKSLEDLPTSQELEQR
jgi:segregation and condensation protein B